MQTMITAEWIENRAVIDSKVRMHGQDLEEETENLLKSKICGTCATVNQAWFWSKIVRCCTNFNRNMSLQKKPSKIENATEEILRYHKQERVYKTLHMFSTSHSKPNINANKTLTTVFPLTSKCQQYKWDDTKARKRDGGATVFSASWLITTPLSFFWIGLIHKTRLRGQYVCFRLFLSQQAHERKFSLSKNSISEFQPMGCKQNQYPPIAPPVNFFQDLLLDPPPYTPPFNQSRLLHKKQISKQSSHIFI